MKVNKLETVEILDYEKQIGQEIEVNEVLEEGYVFGFRARFVNSDENRFGSFGKTIDESLQELCKYFSNSKMHVLNKEVRAFEEIKVPILVHTKLVEK